MIIIIYLLSNDIADSSSGLITLNSAVTLDREMNPKFNLIIQVTDGGVFPSPLSSNATVIIEIQASLAN